MGRGKVKLQRIDDRGRRMACFSKRQNNLLKKARELACLCDVEVAVVVFSPEEKLYSCSSHSSPMHTFERYKRFVDGESNAGNNHCVQNGMHKDCVDRENDDGYRQENRHHNHRFLERSMTELRNLEEELVGELLKIKSIKNELLKDAIPDLN
ncbi:truncated transcription factor CAULIFLOWER A-like isoform X2 [Wolffia australiana]